MVTRPGRLVNGRYRLLSKLGAGGMGNVWLADDERLGRRVALKEIVLSPGGERLSVRRERALREARAAASVEHPGIVEVYDVFEERRRPWIVMAYIRGRSLQELIGRHRPGERDLARIGLAVLAPLRAAHAADVLHRDVKPSNILIDGSGAVFLLDFGIAQIAGHSALTSTNVLTGTLDYISPERLDGRPLAPASDLWSLGATLFHALEGYPPFHHDDFLVTIRAITAHPLPRPRHPGRLFDAIAALLHKDPAERIGAGELASVLESIANNYAPPAPPDRTRPAPPPAARPLTARKAAPPAQPVPAAPPPETPAPETVNSSGSAHEAPPPVMTRPSRLDPAKGARLVSGMEVALAARLLGGLPPENALEVVARVERATAAEILLALQPEKAAAILVAIPVRAVAMLSGMPPKTAATLLERAAVLPVPAAAVLRGLPTAKVGRIVDYLDIGKATALLGVLPPGEAVQILALANVRTAAGAITVSPSADHLIEAMSLRRACAVLDLVPPEVVAELLRRSVDGRADRLLAGLSRSVRAQVRRHLDES